jgi:hypothetical protein
MGPSKDTMPLRNSGTYLFLWYRVKNRLVSIRLSMVLSGTNYETVVKLVTELDDLTTVRSTRLRAPGTKKLGRVLQKEVRGKPDVGLTRPIRPSAAAGATQDDEMPAPIALPDRGPAVTNVLEHLPFSGRSPGRAGVDVTGLQLSCLGERRSS